MNPRKLVSAWALLFACLAGPAFAQKPAGVGASLRFTPVAGDEALQAFAADLGKSPQERQQLVQALAASKTALFEKPYAARGWKNNVAGAYVFFVSSVTLVWTDGAADSAAQDKLFAEFSARLAPSLTDVPNKDKAALYDTLLASALLPVLLHVDGKQQKSQAQLEQARTLVAEYSRKLMHAEPQEVAAMLTGTSGKRGDAPSSGGGAGRFDGRWECVTYRNRLVSGAGGTSMTMLDINPGVSFVVVGNRFTTSGGGGTVSFSGNTVTFSGTDMNGWVGTLLNEGNSLTFSSANKEKCDLKRR